LEASRPSNAAAYAATAAGTRTLATLQNADRYNRWLLDRVSGAVGSRMLEIGCGCGTMSRLLVERELFVGIDVVDEFVSTLNRRFADQPAVTFLRHDISTSTGPLGGYHFDSAVSFNVFEHIEDDVAALRNVCHVLVPGGTLGLVVPAHRSLSGKFDDLIGHWRRYSTRELREKLEDAGFTVDRVAYSNPVGALGWLVQVKVLGRPELGATGLFDRMVPTLAAIEQRVAPPFGLSVVAVARKLR
jgi:cyclopropane fatty-acyl-phospholipid synthase-like methyltransferase